MQKKLHKYVFSRRLIAASGPTVQSGATCFSQCFGVGVFPFCTVPKYHEPILKQTTRPRATKSLLRSSARALSANKDYQNPVELRSFGRGFCACD
jgi:hypothetical protein